MPDTFIETLHSWQNFYFMIGGASAALLGLMFVALSLGLNLIDSKTQQNLRHFVTPSIFYFVTVLLIACAMLVPTYSPTILAILMLIGGGIGLILAGPTVQGLIAAARLHQDFEFADWLFQIIMPLSAQILLIAGGICGLTNFWIVGFIAVWLASVMMIVCGIANTWSMVLWIVEKHTT